MTEENRSTEPGDTPTTNPDEDVIPTQVETSGRQVAPVPSNEVVSDKKPLPPPVLRPFTMGLMILTSAGVGALAAWAAGAETVTEQPEPIAAFVVVSTLVWKLVDQAAKHDERNGVENAAEVFEDAKAGFVFLSVGGALGYTLEAASHDINGSAAAWFVGAVLVPVVFLYFYIGWLREAHARRAAEVEAIQSPEVIQQSGEKPQEPGPGDQ